MVKVQILNIISTSYGNDLCDSYAVVMTAEADGENDSIMVKDY